MTLLSSGHCGPITLDCKVDCLAEVVSLMALNRLVSERDDLHPETVADVIRLVQENKLTNDNFKYLGPRRRSEIEAGLVLAGFDISQPLPSRSAVSTGHSGGTD